MKQSIEFIAVDKLTLDIQNPRLPLAFAKEKRSKKNIIEWLLEDASLIELMLAIGENGFFVGEAILVIKDKENEGRFIVIEGNRRLASVILLNDPALATIQTRKIAKVIELTENRPDTIPCIIFKCRQDIMQYLGYRHVTGIKSWGLLAKARYLYRLSDELGDLNISEKSKILAKKIGSRSDYVKNLLVSYNIYCIIEDYNFYRIPNLNETTFYFNYIKGSLSKEHIRSFIQIDLDREDPIDQINEKNLKQLVTWFFKKNDQDKSRVLGDSSQLKMLNDILGNPIATEKFERGSRLADVHKSLSASPGSFSGDLYRILEQLKNTNEYIHKLEFYNDGDSEILLEIKRLSANMRTIILENTSQ